MSPRRRLPVALRDKNDERTLAAALGAKADFLVTGDDDLLVLRGEPRLRGLRLVTAREFLGLLAEQGSDVSMQRVPPRR